MAFCRDCCASLAHIAFQINGRCVGCERKLQLKEIAEKQKRWLHDAIVKQWMILVEDDLDTLVRYDAYLAGRDAASPEDG